MALLRRFSTYVHLGLDQYGSFAQIFNLCTLVDSKFSCTSVHNLNICVVMNSVAYRKGAKPNFFAKRGSRAMTNAHVWVYIIAWEPPS